jgi:predicted nucleic-acid-binding protein
VIGIDSNVVVRYVAQDDPQQSARATRLLEAELTVESPGFVSVAALAEVAWVLTTIYEAERPVLARVVRGLLAARNVRLQEADAVSRALDDFEATSVDFADALIARLGETAGCTTSVTFDRKAARQPGMTLLA